MAKDYKTKDGKKIVGWYRRGGKAIPIIEGQVKTSEVAKEPSQKKYSKKDDPDYIGADGVRYKTKRGARLSKDQWDHKRFEEEIKDSKDKIKVPVFDYSGDADTWFMSSKRHEYEVDGAFVDENDRVHLFNDGKWETLPKYHEIDRGVPNSMTHTNWGGGDKTGGHEVTVGKYYYPESVWKAKKKAERAQKKLRTNLNKESKKVWGDLSDDEIREKIRKKDLTPEQTADLATNPQSRRRAFGEGIDNVREMGNHMMRMSMMQNNEKDIDKFMKGSNRFEDFARQLEGKRPIVSMAREKIGEAQIHADEVTKDLQDSLKGDAGSVDRGLPFRVKGEDSMHRKIREKAWKKQLQPEEYAEKITDALRFTDMVDGNHFVKSFNKMKEGLAERGYDMVEVENTIHKKGEAYRGVNTLVTSPKGYTFELQFHTPQSFDVKEANHVDYNVERRASTPPAVSKALQEQMKQRSSSIKTPRGASKIENVKRRPRSGPSEDAIRNMMKRRGVDRITAIKYLKEINKY